MYYGVALVLLLFLFATFPTASALNQGPLSDPFVSGSLAVACIFMLLSLLQTIHCFVAIIIMSGHRLPYLMLFPAITLTTVALIVSIPYVIIYASAIPINGILLFTSNWSLVFIFMAIVAFLCDRESTIRTKSNGTCAQRNIAHGIVHATLVVLMLVFATAEAGASVHLQLAVENNSEIDGLEIDRQTHIVDSLYYTFYSLVILSAVDVLVSAILLSRIARKAAISDKITNIILYAVSPLYALLNVSYIAFLIVFSPANRLSNFTWEGADLAWDVIEDLLVFIIFAILLFLSINRASWDLGSALPASTQQGQQYLAPQVVQYQPYQPQPYAFQPYGMQAAPAHPYAQYPAGMQVPSPQSYPQYAAPPPYPPDDAPQPNEHAAPHPYLQQDLPQQEPASLPSPQSPPQHLIQNSTSK